MQHGYAKQKLSVVIDSPGSAHYPGEYFIQLVDCWVTTGKVSPDSLLRSAGWFLACIAEVCLKSRIALATLCVATASLTQTTSSFSPTSGLLLPNFLSLISGPKASWLEVITDVITTCSYFAIFGCIFWVLLKLRRIPQVREYRWIFYCFAAFVTARGAGRLIKVMVDWWPDDFIWSMVRLTIAAISVVTAACFAITASAIATNIKSFVDRFTETSKEKDLALLALSASEIQTNAVRTQAAMTLAETTGRFQMLVEGVRDHALFTVDVDGNVTSWNRGGERLLGYTSSQILGRHFSTLLTAEDCAAGAAVSLLKKAHDLRTSEDEGWRVRSDGSRFWTDVSKSAFYDAEGSIRGFAVIMHDVSVRREAALERNKMEARLRAVVDYAVDGLITIDALGIIETFNPACERLFGFSAAEVMGEPITMLMPEPYRGEHDGYLAHYETTGEGRIIGTPGREVSGKRKNGAIFPMDLSISAFHLEDGRHFSGIVRDITERKKTSLALAETSNRFRLLVEGIKTHALFTVDTRGCVTSWNRGAERLLGYPEAQIIGRHFSCFFNAEDIGRDVPGMQLARAHETGLAADEGWRVRANGETFWADVSKTSLLDDNGSIQGFSIIMQDTTERKKVAIAMEEARLERLRLQEGFLSHVSHELRTPLTAIYFFTTNVLDGLFGDLTPEQRDQLNLTLENANQLKNMVSDLLDITRIETHKLTVTSQPTNLARLVTEVLSTCQTNAIGRDIRLNSEFEKDTPFVWADPSRVRQILTNLVDNGIKFTPDGGRVTVRSEIYTENENFLCLSVSDTGCGIDPKAREIIFERLAQVKSNTEASRSGLGLGLFIAKELVSLHGGRIWVDSMLGEGSTFYLTLPVFSLARWCTRVLAAPDLDSKSVTLITVDIQSLNGPLQGDLIHEIRRALERCIQPGQDVLLPSMSNREMSRNGETIFIVACTGSAGFAVIERRIKRELPSSVNLSRFLPIITSTTVPIPSALGRDEQITEVTAEIERLVKEHLLSKESVN
jgi:PAS domain S-box-containing protein